MAIGDVLELTHVMENEQTGEQMMNKWYYAVVDILGNANGLYNAWVATAGMEDKVCALMSRVMNPKTIRVINLFSLTDFFEGVGTTQGLIANDEMLPMHSAVSITLRLDTRGVRPGSKRISGLTEADQAAGLINGVAYIASLNALLTAIPQDVVESGLGVYDPIVVGRILDPDPTPLGDSPIYRLPADQGEANYGHINLAVANLRVSHQVSRGNGR